MALVNLTSILTAVVTVDPDGTTIEVGAAEIGTNSHFILLHAECTDTDNVVHFIDCQKYPLTWRLQDDEWAIRLSRHMLLLPAVYYTAVNDDDLHPTGATFGLRDITRLQDKDFALARLTLLTFN